MLATCAQQWADEAPAMVGSASEYGVSVVRTFNGSMMNRKRENAHGGSIRHGLFGLLTPGAAA